jgi:PP-loop superfamily ATP-utilizing enzyme
VFSVQSAKLPLKTEDWKLNTPPALARIEVGPTEIAKFLVEDVAGRVAAALKQIGYAHVTLDLLGYRRGS